jgi:hypothetical protein
MSTINQRIITTFTARGGQAIATMNQIGAGFGNVGRAIGENARLSEKLNSQWKALSTTIRYAIAGQAVFGLTRMVGQLNQLQQQIGMISALGDMPAAKVVAGMSDIRTAAVESVTPLTDFNEGLINFYSSVSNPPSINAAADIMKEISLTAQIAQTDVPNASKAITGMLNIFNEAPTLRNVQKYTRAIQDIVTSVPGGREAGAQIMQQFPVIAAQLVAHRGTPAQGLAMFETLTRAGGSPSTWGRGLSFMLQTIGNLGTQTKGVRAAWKSIGVTPDFVAQYGIQAAVNRGITAVRTRGLRTNRRTRGMSDDILDQLTQEMGTAALPGKEIGITGSGAELAGELFGRVHALRAFSLLASNEPQFRKDIQSMTDDFAGTAEAVKRNREKVEKFVEPQALRRAQIAMQGLSQQVQLALEPVANVAANVLAGKNPRDPGGITGFLNKHEDATKWGIRGGAAAVGLHILGRFLGAGSIKKFGIGRLFGGSGGLATTALAAQAIASGDQALGASPLHPMFVVIVGQMGGGMNLGRGSKTGLFGKAAKEAEDAAETAVEIKAAQKGGGLLKRMLGKGIGWGRGARGGAAALTDIGTLSRWGLKAGKFAGPVGVALTAADFFYNAENVNKGENEWIARQEAQRRQTSHANLMKANQLWGKPNDQVTGVGQMGNFNGELWMTIKLKHPDGTTDAKRVHVPVKMWASKYPSSGGTPKTHRSN